MAVKQLDFSYNRDQRGLTTYGEEWVTDSRSEIATVGDGMSGLAETGRTAGPYKGHPVRALVKVTYQGLESNATYGEDHAVWYVEPSFEDNPIETHPNILAIKDIYKGEVNPATGRIRFPLTLMKNLTSGGFTGGDTPGSGKLNPLYGLTSWLTLGCLITKSWCSRTLPKSVLRDIAKIIKTVPGDHGMETPSWGKWLTIAPRYKKKGTAYDIEQSWKLIRDGSGIEIVQRMLNN